MRKRFCRNHQFYHRYPHCLQAAVSIIHIVIIICTCILYVHVAFAVIVNMYVCMVCGVCTVEPLYSGHPWGTRYWPLYRGGLYWGVVLYTNCSFWTWVPGRYTEVVFIQGWPLRGVLLYMYGGWFNCVRQVNPAWYSFYGCRLFLNKLVILSISEAKLMSGYHFSATSEDQVQTTC